MSQTALFRSDDRSTDTISISMAGKTVLVRVSRVNGRIVSVSAPGADDIRAKYINATNGALQAGKSVADLAVQVNAWTDLLLALRRIEVGR